MPQHPRQLISHPEEMVVAVLLSTAVLATSWCSYQAARWSGVQAMHYMESVAARTESIGAAGTANQLMAVDIGLFINWLDAFASGRQQLADFYRTRFRDEFRLAFDVWLATEPLRNAEAPKTPFKLKEYRVAEAVRADELSRKADRHFANAQQANQQSDDYVLVSVVLASVLFLGGIASNFDRRSVRWGMLATATALLVLGLCRIAFYPVA